MRIASLFIIIFLVIMVSCEKDRSPEKPYQESGLSLKASQEEFHSALQNRGIENSDPFMINEITINGDSVEISVSYSGGCEKHFFELIWDGTIDAGDTPSIDLILLHNSNGDACEALIMDKLVFRLSDLVPEIPAGNISIQAMNGSSPSGSVSYKGRVYEFSFEGSEDCVLEVTAARAICGTGLFGSIWFALNDSVASGNDGVYFRKYLQPVAIEKNLAGFVPLEGKRYRLGARITTEFNLDGTVTCLAYPGPSVPVKIICVEEVR